VEKGDIQKPIPFFCCDFAFFSWRCPDFLGRDGDLNSIFSVQPLCSLCLGGGNLKKNHHGDTENSEASPRQTN
jgi:hypothetical protein